MFLELSLYSNILFKIRKRNIKLDSFVDLFSNMESQKIYQAELIYYDKFIKNFLNNK